MIKRSSIFISILFIAPSTHAMQKALIDENPGVKINPADIFDMKFRKLKRNETERFQHKISLAHLAKHDQIDGMLDILVDDAARLVESRDKALEFVKTCKEFQCKFFRDKKKDAKIIAACENNEELVKEKALRWDSVKPGLNPTWFQCFGSRPKALRLLSELAKLRLNLHAQFDLHCDLTSKDVMCSHTGDSIVHALSMYLYCDSKYIRLQKDIINGLLNK